MGGHVWPPTSTRLALFLIAIAVTREPAALAGSDIACSATRKDHDAQAKRYEPQHGRLLVERSIMVGDHARRIPHWRQVLAGHRPTSGRLRPRRRALALVSLDLRVETPGLQHHRETPLESDGRLDAAPSSRSHRRSATLRQNSRRGKHGSSKNSAHQRRISAGQRAR